MDDPLRVARDTRLVVAKPQTLTRAQAPGRVTGGTVEPRLVRFEIAPAPHTRLAQVQALADDLALALRVPEVRISKHLGLIVLEFGRPDPQPVKWQQLLDDVGPLPIGTMLLGLTGEGRPLLARLGAPETAHVLVSGTTGAGKSVLLRTMAASLALTHQASVLGMVAIDLKNRTFPEHPQWSHLCRPVATRPETAAEALRSLVHLMEVRDKRRESSPRIAVFIDELSDLVMTVENAADLVTRLAQRGREAGLHLIAATQYPAAAILEGLMRANFPLRLVGKVVSAEDARVASGRAGTADVIWGPIPRTIRFAECHVYRKTLFELAAECFHQALGLARGESPETGSPGLDYARRRGFTDETLRAAGVGFFGKAWRDLREALRTAGVDLECPAAVALIGYKGDVRAWGEKYNIEPAAQWIEAGKIKALPPNMLIYPHILHGCVVYLSGRYIAPAEDGPKSWNPPSALVGERAPYVNWLWGRAKPESGESPFPYSVIVEGQACALTLGQWGIPALAMAGCDLGERPDAQHPVLVQVQRQLNLTEGRAVLGLDQDAAGAAGTPKLAAALLNLLGLKATAFHAVVWPQVDVNAWLMAGGTAEEARTLLAQAPTWIDVLLENARPAEGAAEGNNRAVRTLFNALAELDVYDAARMREKISHTLQMKRSLFGTLLKAARQETGLDDDGKPKYVTLGGRLCHRFYDGHGNEVFTPLCNFTAQILAEIVEDDGEEQTRMFRIGGYLADGTRLAQVDVAAGDFAAMNWILLRWGARAVVEAGAATRDHLRAALQATSRDVQLQYVYRHLGWRAIDERHVYLSGNGAVGCDEVEVALPPDLARYRLPQQPEHIEDALRASLRFFDVGEHLVTVPLLAAMYFAPLCALVPPTFTLWVYGTTGSLKSTLTALALCHYGKFAYNTPPASWTGTTNALEKKAFLVKDAPLWIDDYTTQSTFQGMNELKGKVDQLLRDWGNRSGRSRMSADLQLRQTFAPRGLIIGTAEQLPPGQSIQARLFQVEVHPEMITRGADSPLKKAQIEDAPLYPHAIAGYVQWLAEQWDTLTEALPDRLLTYTEAAREKGAHLRMPNNVATLFLGWELFLDYCLHCKVVTDTEYANLRELGWTVLIALGEAQQDVAQEEKPAALYLSALRQLLHQGTLYLRSREYPDLVDQEYPKLSVRAANAEFVGWYDEQYIYLLSKVALRVVHKFYRDSGVVFPDTEHGVKVKLKEQGLLFPAESEKRGGFMYQLPIDERPRVLRITNFLSSDNEGSTWKMVKLVNMVKSVHIFHQFHRFNDFCRRGRGL